MCTIVDGLRFRSVASLDLALTSATCVSCACPLQTFKDVGGAAARLQWGGFLLDQGESFPDDVLVIAQVP